jgi:putative oxidoreductase
MRIARLLGRLVLGGLFMAHGSQKLFGWFDGPGLDNFAAALEKMNMKPGRRNAVAAGLSEAGGGAAIALGAFTPLAAASLIGAMVTAIRTVHLKGGFFAANGGYEFNLTLIAALLILVDGGPGDLSIDSALGIEDTGHGWALTAAALGVAGSTLAMAAGARGAPEAPPADSQPST